MTLYMCVYMYYNLTLKYLYIFNGLLVSLFIT